ncbi:hypothetical protein RRG08_002278 [Elysia crispata]|uniref:Kazal-like domain-containing protein n=1 Tax=Elysia crispata TaxID=231223 RepID=A0AAE1DD41_9GAST|nr:hypothetical protein RRG08_002278 [Elysia crispata]
MKSFRLSYFPLVITTSNIQKQRVLDIDCCAGNCQTRVMASMCTTVFLLIWCGICLTLACDPNVRPVCSGSNGPVCATFHKNFDDLCAMKAELCRLAQEGFHFVEHHVKDCCKGLMTLEWSPRCASDGKTYGNGWDMFYAACRNRDYLTVAAPNTCSDYPKPMF